MASQPAPRDPGGLAWRLVRYVRSGLRRHLHFGNYYIYRYSIPDVDPNVNLPKVENLEVRIIESSADFRRLMAEVQEDPRIRVPSMERRLNAGAVAVCGFVSGRLAYCGWVATSDRAKRSFDPLPYRVAYDEGEAVTGGAWTSEEFRGVGLYRYMFGRELDYLRRNGRSICRNSIAVGNYASQRGQAVYGAMVCARARAIRVLGFKTWSEHPWSGPCPSLSRETRR